MVSRYLHRYSSSYRSESDLFDISVIPFPMTKQTTPPLFLVNIGSLLYLTSHWFEITILITHLSPLFLPPSLPPFPPVALPPVPV